MVTKFCVGIVTKLVDNSLTVMSEGCCHSNEYQILYELPLVAMTTLTSGTLPSVAPVKLALYKGLYYNNFSLVTWLSHIRDRQLLIVSQTVITTKIYCLHIVV